MILSFGDKATENIYHGVNSLRTRKLLPMLLVKTAKRKLDMLSGAHKLDDLQVPPGNRLEALSGDLKGYFSIRINVQYRIIFKWCEDGVKEVKIVDYH